METSSFLTNKTYILILILSAFVLGFFVNFLLIKFQVSFFTPTKTPLSINPTPTPQKLLLNCPVEASLCKLGQTAEFNKQPALAYKLSSGTKIFSMAQVVDSKQFITQPYKSTNPIGLYQSFIFNNECYTITYTMPYDSKITKIDLLPLETGQQVATAGRQLLPYTDIATNLFIQLQKRPIEATRSSLPEFQKCPVTNLKPADFGSYQKIDTSSFK